MRLIISIILFVVTVTAQAQDVTYFKENIEELSSKKYGGRGYYKDNDGKAAQYIADEFAKSGAVTCAQIFAGNSEISAAGVNGYFQEIEFPINDFNGKVDFIVDGKTMRPGYDYSIGTYSASANGTFDVHYLDTSDLDLKKTIELLKEKGENWAVVVDMDFKAQQLMMALSAQKIKLGGLIIRDGAEQMKQMMQLSGMADNDAMTKVSPVMTNKMYVDLIKFQFPQLTVDKSTFPLDAKKVSLNVEMEFTQEKSSNVIAVIPGSVNSDSIFVFTAHYDHLGMFGKKDFHPGANDNASGTSMLLTLAKHYGKPENKPANTLVFVATTAEEMGLLGSRAFVDNPPFNLKNIKYVLNFDMIADITDTITTYSDKCGMRGYDLFNAINAKEALFKDITYNKYQQNSDHYPFLRKKVPAICFILEKGEYFKYLHTLIDDVNHVSYSNFPKLFKLVTEFVKQY